MRFYANFKMHHTRASTSEYIDLLNCELENIASGTVTIFPPATALQESCGKIIVGAQNAYFEKSGAYTGEIGLMQLKEFGIDTILIGHSERRQLFGESQEFIEKKYSYYQEQGFHIVYCIGEPLEIRQQGEEALFEYLYAQFEGIDIEYERLTVAYEPIWAIGTGVSATVADIELVHNRLKEKFSFPLLYGGSVKVDSVAKIAAIASVDGVLVGSASLDAKEFARLIKRGLGVEGSS